MSCCLSIKVCVHKPPVVWRSEWLSRSTQEVIHTLRTADGARHCVDMSTECVCVNGASGKHSHSCSILSVRGFACQDIIENPYQVLE